MMDFADFAEHSINAIALEKRTCLSLIYYFDERAELFSIYYSCASITIKILRTRHAISRLRFAATRPPQPSFRDILLS